MTRVQVTVDEQGRLSLPAEVAAQLRTGQTLTIDLELGRPANPFEQVMGSLPPLGTDSRTYYRRERGREEGEGEENGEE